VPVLPGGSGSLLWRRSALECCAWSSPLAWKSAYARLQRVALGTP